jgi:hypothetical protein
MHFNFSFYEIRKTPAAISSSFKRAAFFSNQENNISIQSTHQFTRKSMNKNKQDAFFILINILIVLKKQ